MRLPHVFLTALVLTVFARPAQAVPVLFSNLGQPDNGLASFDDTSTRLASDFLTDGTARTITSITALMLNTGFITHTVTFGIYTDDGSGEPGALVGTFDTPASIPSGGSGNFTATGTGINLLANTPYWVVGQVDEEPILGSVYWDFNSGDGYDGTPFATIAGTDIMRSTTAGFFYSSVDTGNLLYELDGVTTVPEPSALVLSGLTALGTGCAGWRRRRKAGHPARAEMEKK